MRQHVYIVQKWPSPSHSRPCNAYKVDTSPAFQQYHSEEIGYTTPIIFNWETMFMLEITLPLVPDPVVME